MKPLNILFFFVLACSFSPTTLASSKTSSCQLFLNQKKDCREGEFLEVSVVHGDTCAYSCVKQDKVACAEMIYSANQNARGRSLSSKVFDGAFRPKKNSKAEPPLSGGGRSQER